MVQLLNSIYLGAAKPEDYGKAAGVVELLPFDYYLGAAVPSTGVPTFDVLLSGVSPLTILNAVKLNYIKAFGKCEQASTPTPTSPVDIVCNNGAIKVKDDELPVGYKRLLDISTTGNVRYISNVYLTGNDTLKFSFKAAAGNLLGAYNDTDANDNFSFYNSTGAGASYARYNGQTGGSSTYTSAEYTVIISPTGVTGVRNPSSFTPTEFTCSIPFCVFATSPTGSVHSNATIYGSIEVTGSQNVKFIPCERVSDGAIGYYETSNSMFLENQESGTPTTSGYDTSHLTEIYYDGTVETVSVNNTSATCQPLLSVGTYKDSQNITNGAITRNVGVKVLDGTEDWRLYSSTICLYDTVDAYKPASPMAILSTHFAGSSQSTSQQSANTIRLTYGNSDFGIFSIRLEGTSADNAVDELKQFLASQYAAGTPVIVVYPLATPTTETVTGQTLTITQGTNIVTAEGSVDDLELEVSYKAYAEITVEEIEAVNTDENVEVTIS